MTNSRPIAEFNDVPHGGLNPFDDDEMRNTFRNSEVNKVNDHGVDHASRVVNVKVCREIDHRFDFNFRIRRNYKEKEI